jgi:replicative DNA helicase
MAKDDDVIGRMPPQSIEAEMAVLGSMLIEPEAANLVIEKLDETCFYRESHNKIFRVATSLYLRNEPIDILTVSNELEKKNELESIGGRYYLTELVERIPSAANVEYYCNIVLDKAILRKMIAVSSEIQQDCYEAAEEAHDIVDKAESKIFELAETRHRKDYYHIKTILNETMETYESYHGRAGGITGVPTGYKALDELLSGLQKSELIILAARPSMGKTALALNIARRAAKLDLPVGIFSLEMSSIQLAMRMLCSEARVDSHKARTGKLPDDEWMRLSLAVGGLADAPIYIDDTPSMNILELRSKARRLKAEFDISLLIVDYLQLLHGVGKIESRQNEISMISQSLKALAKELNIPIMALSQLSRAVESRGGERRPLLSDLRESGAIEQDADVVIFIYRPAGYGQVEPELEHVAEIIVAKQRNGPTDKVELVFIKEYVQFENKEEYAEYLPTVTPDLF